MLSELWRSQYYNTVTKKRFPTWPVVIERESGVSLTRCGTAFGFEIGDAKKGTYVKINGQSKSAIKSAPLYGSWFMAIFWKIISAITFLLLFCSLSTLREKWSAKNFKSKGIKNVKVWIEIKKFVFQRFAVCEFFLPLRGFANTSYCADLLVSIEARCRQNFGKSVCREYFNVVEESLILLPLRYAATTVRGRVPWTDRTTGGRSHVAGVSLNKEYLSKKNCYEILVFRRLAKVRTWYAAHCGMSA